MPPGCERRSFDHCAAAIGMSTHRIWRIRVVVMDEQLRIGQAPVGTVRACAQRLRRRATPWARRLRSSWTASIRQRGGTRLGDARHPNEARLANPVVRAADSLGHHRMAALGAGCHVYLPLAGAAREAYCHVQVLTLQMENRSLSGTIAEIRVDELIHFGIAALGSHQL